ncbi:MAG: TonB-dependent receptor plug domain-containing protein [Pseudomonadota bacterium]
MKFSKMTCSLFALVAAAQLAAYAQETGSTSGADAEAEDASGSLLLNSVTVVAQRREELAQDVGVAISAYSGPQLDALGVTETSQLAALTPGVHISGALGGQLQTFTIRGVAQSDFVETAESPNAVYIDEAYVGYVNGARTAMFDTNRVEILKGPQGTLFGRNATGGLVHYISNRPTDELEGYADITMGSFNHARFEGAVSGPISSGMNGRLAGFMNRHDGTIKNRFPGGADLANDDTYGIRGMLDFDLGESFDLLLKGELGRSETSTAPYQSTPTIALVNADGFFVDTVFAGPNETRLGIGPGGANVCPGCLTANPVRPVPGGDFSGGAAVPEDSRTVNTEFSDDDANELDSRAFTATLTGQVFDGLEFVSVTDYREYDKTVFFDNDAQPYYHLTSFFFVENEQLSQEFRLSGNGDNYRWSSGLYYLNNKTDVDSGFFTAVGPNPTDPLENRIRLCFKIRLILKPNASQVERWNRWIE